VLDTSTWPEIKLDVLKDLHLDPRNVRLDETADTRVEADIIEDMFANEDALGLVKGICTVGYLTHDVPIAIKRRGRYVMVEGNRRLAALKAIQNPHLVPDFSTRVATLAENLPDRRKLATIRVMIVPRQDDADQVVAAIHTANLRKRWSPARQAAFFQAQVDNGRSLKALIERYPQLNVPKFVLRALMLNEFRSVKYSDPALTDFIQGKERGRGLSTLIRIYESKAFKDITGFDMDGTGKLSKSISNARFKRIATVIVSGMRDNDLNTRTLNSVNSDRFKALMNELAAIAGASPPYPTTTAGEERTDDKSKDGGRGTSSTRRTRQTPRLLDLSNVAIPSSYPRAVALYKGELEGLSIQRFPNTGFVMLRAVLEKTIKAFAEAKGEDIKQTHRGDNGQVHLNHALLWLLDHVQTHSRRDLIDPIEKVRTGRLVSFATTAAALNAGNHNPHFGVDPVDTSDLWNAIEPIMRYVTTP
jgi:hypothetical protein